MLLSLEEPYISSSIGNKVSNLNILITFIEQD